MLYKLSPITQFLFNPIPLNLRFSKLSFQWLNWQITALDFRWPRYSSSNMVSTASSIAMNSIQQGLPSFQKYLMESFDSPMDQLFMAIWQYLRGQMNNDAFGIETMVMNWHMDLSWSPSLMMPPHTSKLSTVSITVSGSESSESSLGSDSDIWIQTTFS